MTASRYPEIFVPLDTTDTAQALRWAASVAPHGCGLKMGLEYFSAAGLAGMKAVIDAHPDAPFFLDLKYHDIPNTVAGAVRAGAQLRPQYLNVHASGGADMMRAALDAAADTAAKGGFARPGVLAVTVLTSLDDAALSDIGCAHAAAGQVLRLAALTQKAGLDGVVCSAHEIEILRRECGPDFVLMVPGIRPAGADAGDQKRVMTPADAFARGATHLVIGRPITGAADPGKAARAILDSLE